MAKWQVITTDVAHRAGVTVMRKGGTYAAFETGGLCRVRIGGENVEAGSYSACVSQLFQGSK